MKATIFASAAVLAGSAFAASSSYIPSGISTQCSSFLDTLNTDTTLATCTSSLIAATNNTSAALSATLDTLCNSDQCSNTAVRQLLTSFYSACPDELAGSSPNNDARDLYDVLYAFLPFRAAVCAKDPTSGSYCASSLASTTPASSKRAASNPTVDPTSLTTSGTPFLFMLPSSSASQLCTACGAAVMQSYVTWEAATPYAFGLAQSPILGSQSALWDAFTSKCGPSFMSTITADSNAAPLAALRTGGAAPAQKPYFAALLGVAGLGAALIM